MGNPFSTSYPQTINYSTATTTQNQGGGDKKAGNVPTKNVSAWTMIYYHSRGLPLPRKEWIMPLVSNTQPSRPIWVTRNPPKFTSA